MRQHKHNHAISESKANNAVKIWGCRCYISGWEPVGGNAKMLHFHHIRPLELGGGEEPENLLPLQEKEHTKVHQKLNKIIAGLRKEGYSAGQISIILTNNFLFDIVLDMKKEYEEESRKIDGKRIILLGTKLLEGKIIRL
ncbi:MAG: HNH endonuclease signature motif containing protein [Candidatus Micrarchaeota archaeon]